MHSTDFGRRRPLQIGLAAKVEQARPVRPIAASTLANEDLPVSPGFILARTEELRAGQASISAGAHEGLTRFV
jgi:hypothetical protein